VSFYSQVTKAIQYVVLTGCLMFNQEFYSPYNQQLSISLVYKMVISYTKLLGILRCRVTSIQ